MKIYIWEGDGISTGYHNDGTLVVLAGSAEQAREIAIQSARDWAALNEEKYADEGGDKPAYNAHWVDGTFGGTAGIYWPGHKPGRDDIPDDEVNPAIRREPDRVVELNVPSLVAFNGGGYD